MSTEYSKEVGLSITSNVGFKRICVIDSIPNGDKQTANELYEDILYYRSILDPGLLIQQIRVETDAELFTAFENIHDELSKTGAIPHFISKYMGTRMEYNLRQETSSSLKGYSAL